MKSKIILIHLIGLCLANLSSKAQNDTTVVSTILAGKYKTVLAKNLTDATKLIVTNTGIVPLKFCLSNTVNSACVGASSKTVNVASSSTFTIGDMGGVSQGTNLNVSNTSDGGVGSFVAVVSRLANQATTTTLDLCGNIITPGTNLPLIPSWQPINGTTGGGTNPFLNPVLYACPTGTKVGIGTKTPQAALDVYGGGLFSGSLAVNDKIGIGTTSPSIAQLEIHGANTTSMYIEHITSTSGTYDYGALIKADNANTKALVIQSGANENVILSANGNIFSAGTVGIGTNQTGSFRLAVDGNIGAREIRVVAGQGAFPDYVFEKNYKLKSLYEIEKYINKNKHLPEIPSAQEVEDNKGIDLGDMNVKLLKKVEELTLYVIKMQKEIDALKQSNVNQLK